MESLGEKLRNAREEKDLTLEQVGRETNITIRYLEGLEAEDFSCFPGFPSEPYIIGFLRNYGAYLELDVDGLLSLYRSIKIREQPIPEQLFKTPSKLPKILAVLAVIFVIIGAVGGGVFFLLTRPKKPDAPAQISRTPAEYTFNGDSFERRFYKGDSVLVPLAANQYKLELDNLGEAVTVRTPAGSVILDLSQEANVDLNNDGLADLRITAADFAKNNAGMGALLRLNMINAVPAAVAPQASAPLPSESAPVSTPSANTTVIISSPNAYPFTLRAIFQGYCMFRWEILFERDRRDRNERYFQRSDDPLNIQANNGIRVWASNAKAASWQIIGGGRTYDFELGGAGEVVVADIRWLQDEDKRFRLVLARLETGSS